MKKHYRVFITIILFLGALGMPYPGKAAPPEQSEEPPAAPDPAAPLVLDTEDNFGYTYLLSPFQLPETNPFEEEKPWWVNPSTMVDVFPLPPGIPEGNLIISETMEFQANQGAPIPVDCSVSRPLTVVKFHSTKICIHRSKSCQRHDPLR
jgi:hypothetical protein